MVDVVIVANGVRFGEGPVWWPDTGELLVTSVMDGLIHRIDPVRGTVGQLADLGGGPNGMTPVTDGVLVTQNGGIDFRALDPSYADAPPLRRRDPGLVFVGLDGTIEVLAVGRGLMRAPNDLVVAADGTVIFTDPPPPRSGRGREGRVLRWSPSTAAGAPGRFDVLVDGLDYPNGVGIDLAGAIVFVEQDGLMRIEPGREPSWFVRELGEGGGDGIAFDVDGNCYVCAKTRGCIRVVDPNGTIVDTLWVPQPARLTNCCFGGTDLRTLFVTDAHNDTVLAISPTPIPGRPLIVGHV